MRFPEHFIRHAHMLFWTHIAAVIIGIRISEWSAKEDHATARAVGLWLRSWFF